MMVGGNITYISCQSYFTLHKNRRKAGDSKFRKPKGHFDTSSISCKDDVETCGIVAFACSGVMC